jgi:hypothetical protein
MAKDDVKAPMVVKESKVDDNGNVETIFNLTLPEYSQTIIILEKHSGTIAKQLNLLTKK